MVRVRILTINVENVEGDPRRQNLLRTGIEELEPDLVALQEVVHSPERDQLHELLASSKLDGTHQSDTLAYEPPWADHYGGTALASRWPYRVVETLDLRLAAASDVPWCTMAAVVEVPDAGPMLFIGSTGAWRLDAAALRERQALAVTDLDARHRQELPTVIAGDFNADPDSSSIRYLTGRQSLAGASVHYHDAWEVAGDGPGYTWTADNSNAAAVMDRVVRQPSSRHRFDYVFVGSTHAHPTGSCRIVSAGLAFDRPVDGAWPSDHFGVVVDTEVETIRPS
jgi:endonuclease/exonuclease/phosphatase family metal-dependent hydrolase